VLLQRRTGSQAEILDSRIALCLPSSGPSRQQSQVSGELATLRETQAVYFTQPDTESDLIRQTLRRRQQGLEEALLADDAARYSAEVVLTEGGASTYVSSIFAGSDPQAWFTRIGQWLLMRAYPGLPVAAQALPRPVVPEDAGRLFQSIYSHPGSSRGLLAELGPGLRLSTPEAPGEYNPAHCPVFGLVLGWLSSHPAPSPWAELHHYLAHEVGLTRPLATLYLLLYLHHVAPELEVRLHPRHRLALLSGRTLPGTQLTGELVPQVQWDPLLPEWIAAIGPATEPQWNDALPYLGALSPRLAPASDRAALARQETELRSAVDQVARSVSQGRELLWQLSPAAGGTAASSQVSDMLQRLGAIAGDGFQSVYRSVRETYPDSRQMEEDLSSLRQLEQLGSHASSLRQAREYLNAAAVPAAMAELSVLRQALQAALSQESLLWLSRSWILVEQQVSAFKAQYGAAYRSHHQDIHAALPAYLEDRDTAGRRLRGVTLLNALPELGDPTGQGLEDSLAHLWQGPPACTVSPDALPLDLAPLCSHCRLALDQRLPSQELARLGATIASLLASKHRRLSNALVERVLQGKADQRLEDLLKIVQASNLSALSNTLNTELVAFIRRVLE
jgi:hypothetical protein